MPTISIIVPVYNSSRFLRTCLDSLVNQTFRDIEIICVNDGSTDDSLMILNEYAGRDSRVRVLSKKNEGKGAASARNMGLENAVGEYVQFLDSDDFFELQMAQQLINKARAADADIVVYGAKWFDDKTQQFAGNYNPIRLDLAPESEPFSYRACPKYIFQIGDVIPWNKLYRKALIDKYNLRFEEIPISDDHYVSSLSLVFAKRIATVKEQFTIYRTNTGTAQSDTRTKHPESAYRAFPSIIAAMKQHGIYEDIRQSYINIILPCVRWYYDVMGTFEAFEFLHNKLRNEVFFDLEVTELPEEYFYDPRLYKWLRMIIENTAADVAFQAAYKLSRAYGSIPATTAILRF